MTTENRKHPLLRIRGLQVEGFADGKWNEIVHGVDLDLDRGQVLGLIGESGAGKSTIGLAAMGFTRDGCRISGGSGADHHRGIGPARSSRFAHSLRGAIRRGIVQPGAQAR